MSNHYVVHLKLRQFCMSTVIGKQINFFLIFILIQLQLYAFSPHPSTLPLKK